MAKKSRKRTKAVAPAPAKKALTRREVIGWAKGGAVGLAVVGTIGYLTVSSVMATHAEMDLTRIGNGTPAVVQIHDPGCPTCTALQREARDAVGMLDDGVLTFVVANIKTDEGRDFANRHGVGHVTLLLLDGDGAVRNVLTGMRSADELRVTFERHIAAGARG